MEKSMTDEQKNFDFSHITVNFRWILPILFAGYVIAWSINENWKNQRFDNLQTGQEKTWGAIKTIDSKIDAVKDKEAADFVYVLQHYVAPTTIHQ